MYITLLQSQTVRTIFIWRVLKYLQLQLVVYGVGRIQHNISSTLKAKNNILADTISRLKTLNIYKEPLEKTKTPVVSNAQERMCYWNTCNWDMHTLSTTMLCTEQKWDTMCRKLACHNYATATIVTSWQLVIMSTNGILTKTAICIHHLKHDITIDIMFISTNYPCISSMTPNVIKELFIHLRL